MVFTPPKNTELIKDFDNSSPFGLKDPKSSNPSTNCFNTYSQNTQGMIGFGNSPQMTKQDAENFANVPPPSPETPLEDLI